VKIPTFHVIFILFYFIFYYFALFYFPLFTLFSSRKVNISVFPMQYGQNGIFCFMELILELLF